MKRAPEEFKRLSFNQNALLGLSPEIILLIDNSGDIKYMNRNALEYLNHQVFRNGGEKIQDQFVELVKSFPSKNNDNNFTRRIVGEFFFDYRIAPFKGYKGDKLFWLLIKNPKKDNEDSGKSRTRQLTDNKIVGSSDLLKDLLSVIERVARTDTTVLITGESGTGKELVANILKEKSNRCDNPYLTINCTTISELLLESELFGYEKGSFTGADDQRKGKFEIADGGTIFLDEIGDISPRMQAALLRVLQNGEITRVGGHKPIEVDVRIIAATNKDLTNAVEQGTFRLDLFYRLNIINVDLPPLRERKEDIKELSTYFIKKFSHLYATSIDYDMDSILEKLKNYDWPGNIRELENVIHRAVLLCRKNYLRSSDISFDLEQNVKGLLTNPATITRQFAKQPLKNTFCQVEKEVLIETLRLNKGDVVKSAKSLDISKSTFYEKMKQHEINIKSLL
jgi:Nif-specific regulatory protein